MVQKRCLVLYRHAVIGYKMLPLIWLMPGVYLMHILKIKEISGLLIGQQIMEILFLKVVYSYLKERFIN